ncbi:hypothetical protein T01_3944 [Trichinella spiralis]|uniref:Uncharacterized protein n=2 Tax=Trichinella spiralis TaxID=6334 RepID=A0A0V1BHB7_TRISP|nr:hypothetical protein T01_3944 [Trichinella spiralis]
MYYFRRPESAKNAVHQMAGNGGCFHVRRGKYLWPFCEVVTDNEEIAVSASLLVGTGNQRVVFAWVRVPSPGALSERRRRHTSDTNLLRLLAVAASRTVAGSSPNFSPPPSVHQSDDYGLGPELPGRVCEVSQEAAFSCSCPVLPILG